MKYVLRAEFHKFKGMFKRYYIDSVAEVISYAILFLGVFFTVFQDVSWTSESFFQLIVGIFIWYIGISAVAIFTFILQEEMQLGTLEQIYLTRTSLTKMLLGRALGTFCFDALSGIVLTSLTFIGISLFTSLSIIDLMSVEVSLIGLVTILFATMIGIYGFAFILAGLSIRYKKVSAITFILNYIFLFFTGITLSSEQLPFVLDIVSKLLPITWGIINLQNLLLEEQNFSHLIVSSDFYILLIHSTIYFGLGIFIFKIMERKSKKDGNLGHY
jgi:ABC-2 type transport system permease protein